jgi:hypothetical protein
MSSNDSIIDTIIAQIADLSFADKLVLNERIATALRKEGKSGKIGKASKPKKSKDAPKRDVAVGTLAWIAFVKHCKTEFADRFEGITLEKERLAVAKAIREEDKDAYDTFVTNFKNEHSSASNDDSDDAPSSPVVTAPVPVVAPKMSAAEKVAALKAKAAASSAPKTAAVTKSAPTPAPVTTAAPKKEVKKAAASKSAAKVTSPKASAKKAAPAPKVEEPAGDDDAMPTKTIDDVVYFFDADTKGLWMREDDGGFGPWTGYLNDDGTIRFTDAPDA